MAKGGHQAPLSRSGLWLIGATLLFSLVVFAWAFQEERPRQAPGSALRVKAMPSRRFAALPPFDAEHGARSPEREAQPADPRPPSVGDYGPLLERNLFRPRVTSDAGRRPPLAARRPAPALPRAAVSGPEPRAASEASTDAWRGWRFAGVAHLDQKRYALMDQPGKKQSRFVRPGDRLEDAVVARVEPDAVTLREAEGGLVHVQRVDAMAELLRPSRSRPSPRPGQDVEGPPPGPALDPAPVAATPGREVPASLGPGAGGLDAEARRARRERPFREQHVPGPSSEPPISEDE